MLEKASDELDDIKGGLAVAITAFLLIGESDYSIFRCQMEHRIRTWEK